MSSLLLSISCQKRQKGTNWVVERERSATAAAMAKTSKPKSTNQSLPSQVGRGQSRKGCTYSEVLPTNKIEIAKQQVTFNNNRHVLFDLMTWFNLEETFYAKAAGSETWMNCDETEIARVVPTGSSTWFVRRQSSELTPINWPPSTNVVLWCPASILTSMGVWTQSRRRCSVLRIVFLPIAFQANKTPGQPQQMSGLTTQSEHLPTRHPAFTAPHPSCFPSTWEPILEQILQICCCCLWSAACRLPSGSSTPKITFTAKYRVTKAPTALHFQTCSSNCSRLDSPKHRSANCRSAKRTFCNPEHAAGKERIQRCYYLQYEIWKRLPACGPVHLCIDKMASAGWTWVLNSFGFGDAWFVHFRTMFGYMGSTLGKCFLCKD